MDPIIRVEHLSKRYKGATVPAVDDVSFDVAPGELFAFLGPNGAGKTTTISIPTGFSVAAFFLSPASKRQTMRCGSCAGTCPGSMAP